jgi:predicted phosphodiesterase
MRLAALSDIHGNLWALDAVLADLDRVGADRIVVLGDLLSGPLLPAETAVRLIDELEGRRRALFLAGNHERQLLGCGAPGRRAALPEFDSDRFAYESCTEAQRLWLARLPRLALDLREELGVDVLLCHGTPTSDLDYLVETVDPQAARGCRMARPGEVAARLGAVDHGLVLCGHSHRPRCLQLADGRMVVNPGSVGLPAYDDDHVAPHFIECGSPHARYAIVELGPGGWSVEQRLVAYDWLPARALAAERGRSDWVQGLSGWMGD